MAYCLRKTGVIEAIGKQGRAYLYAVVGAEPSGWTHQRRSRCCDKTEKGDMSMRISRRQFVTASALVAGGVVVAGGGAMFVKLKNTDPFALYITATGEVLARHFGEDLAAALHHAAWQEYQSLLPQVPDIGGEENLNSGNLVASAYTLAVYRVLQARGLATEEAGRMIYEAYEAASDVPRWLGGFLDRMRRGAKYEAQWRAQAVRSQQRQYPGDWVFTFVEGDGEDIDYGLDFTECGICKYYHAQGADELTPYLCLMDGVVSKAFGLGLVRHKTLAEDADICDFRYKAGGETFLYPLRDGWPPKFLKKNA
jgi:hypothetical protein